MKYKWTAMSWLLVLGACHGPVPSSQLPEVAERIERQQNAPFDSESKMYTNQIQLQLDESISLDELVHEVAANKGIVLSLIDEIPGQRIYLFEYSAHKDIVGVARDLKADSRVLRAGANYRVELNSTNDPRLAKQWALWNEGQDIPGALAGRKGADIGFDLDSTQGSHNVVVAVVDTGVDYFHEDLAKTEVINGRRQVLPGSNIWINPHEQFDGRNTDNSGDANHAYIDDVHGYNFVHFNGDPMDDHGHGTHVAGVIGALRHNLKGIVGMNAQVSIMGVKFLSAGGGGSLFGAESAIFYVTQMAKRFPEKKWIMNHSWGSSSRGSEDGVLDDFLFVAFEAADEAGIINVAAAGNSGESNRFSPSYPANYTRDLTGFITVAASNNLDQLAEFSSYGYDYVDVAAPGVLIESTVLDNGYAAWSGTSMASPHVAGLAALIWAQEPELTAVEVKDRILNTVDLVPQLEGLVTSGGRINVGRALAADTNIGILKADREVVAKSLQSPVLKAGARVDTTMTVGEEGAKSIQVCFERIHLQSQFDWLQIHGSDYVIRDLVTGRHSARRWESLKGEELCSAPVPGDTVHLRLFTDTQMQETAGSTGFKIESLKVQR